MRERMARALGIAALSCWALSLGLIGPVDARAAGPQPVLDAGADAPPDAAGEASTDAAEPAPDAVVDTRIAELQARHEALLDVLAGTLGAKPLLSELLGVDLADDAAVAARLKVVRATLAAAVAPATPDAGLAADAGGDAHDGDAGTLDAGTKSPVDTLEHEVLALEEKILSLPRETRVARVDAQRELVRKQKEKTEHETALKEAEQAVAAAQVAQKKAAAAAESAHTIAERAIAETRASLEGVRLEQAKLRRTIAEERQSLVDGGHARAKRLQELSAATANAPIHSPAADGTFDEIVAELRKARSTLGARIDAYVSPGTVPAWTGQLGATAIAEPAQRAVLEGLVAETARSATELDGSLRDVRWDALRAAVDWEHELNRLRLGLLDRLSPDKQDRVLGFGPEGLDQLQRELQHVQLVIRWSRVAGTRLALEKLHALKSPATAGVVLTRLLLLVAVIWATVRVRRASVAALARLREVVPRALRPPWSRWSSRALEAIEAVRAELIALGGVVAVPAVTGLAREGPFAALYGIVIWYAIYRLALAAAHRLLAKATETGVALVDEERSARAMASARSVGRYALGVGLVLAISAELLGKGYLYRLVARFAWVGAVPIAVALIRAWQRDIADGFLALRPARTEGKFAELVRGSRDEWHGFFVAVAAFAVLVAMKGARLARSFVLGFDQSRKALAYLFRRRLERRVEVEPEAAAAQALPDDLRAHLAQTPVEDEALLVDRWPGLDALRATVSAFREGKAGAILVVARTGFGKTTWVRRALAQHVGDLKRDLVTPRSRVIGREALVRMLDDALELRLSANTVDALVEALRASGPRVVAIDDLQLLVRRSFGGVDAYAAFMEVVERTRGRVMWIAACAHYGWQYVRWVRRSDDAFRDVVRLPSWSEQEIAELLARRTFAAGYRLDYHELLTEPLEGPDADAQLLVTARDYNRLIWDFAEGSPRVALSAWASSLRIAGDRQARVRLFRRYPESVFEPLVEDEKLVLAGIVWHERASLQDLVTTLRLPPLTCEIAIEKLRERGAIEVEDDGYRLTTVAWPVALRYLRRRHFVTS